MTTFRQLLLEFNESSTSKADKGRIFEEFCQAFFRTDPLFANRFDEVWLWNSWPGRDGETDSGVDLVAKEAVTGDLVAIQCKFYDPTVTISQSHLAKFLNVLGRPEFTSGIFISTTSKPWSPKADEQCVRFGKPVAKFGVQNFDESKVDWGQFRLELPTDMTLESPKELRPHQTKAIDEVINGLNENDRGQLIMACGTGKTFTSLRLAERQVGQGGNVLFLVPSINLLSQSVKAWAEDASLPIRSFAVCSDSRAGRRDRGEDASPNDLIFPASTDVESLAKRYQETASDEAMNVVFSTYQSIDVVGECQQHGIPEFDLIIADEAHRTTGVTLDGEEHSTFTRVHYDDHVSGKKRLYMTATPRVFADRTKAKAKDHQAFLATMDDKAIFGPEFHRLPFGEAVEAKLLTDYKVLVLAVDEGEVSRAFQKQLADDGIELNIDDAAKMIGCWHALSKRGPQFEDDKLPMKRAVSFTSTIKESISFSNVFPKIVEDALEEWSDKNAIRVESEHVDGKTNVLERSRKIAWLEEEPGQAVCRVLSNAKCLTEGVDVPALDSILFLKPRKSIVDVVQAVGRVMRLAPGKDMGYVILPIAVPSGVTPEVALKDNKRYEVVWEVLQALRSHDERLNAEINKIDVNGQSSKVNVIGIGLGGSGEERVETNSSNGEQSQLEFSTVGSWRDALYARIVEKVGDRHYWDKWAKDIALIAERHETRIRGILDRQDINPDIINDFESFHNALKAHLNDSINKDDAIAMLSQHLITKPVFDALFGEEQFIRSNSVSNAMQRMVELLDERGVDRESDELKKFYDSVRLRAEGITDAAGKQRIIAELYEQFFYNAIPKVAQSLGIVYTPTEVVDFINRSTNDLLKKHFDGTSIADDGVHVLDPFTGTGTFITRMMQSGLISNEDLPRKYREELHANEIVLLAYYVAALNIETTLHDLIEGAEYEPFNNMVLTDTFQMTEEDDLVDADIFPRNNARVDRQKALDIRVIIGNPPYSAGQGSQNDNNANLAYPALDASIARTYAHYSTGTNLNSLYDSYIRAIRWASDRIGNTADGGIIGYVTNGGWLDGNSADGIRRTLCQEFHHIYVYNLRGNARTSGEQRRKESGNVFEHGSRSTVAISFLVKQPGSVPESGGQIHYVDIGDYLTREQKLDTISQAHIDNLEWKPITPNKDADWINQRNSNYENLVPLTGEDGLFVVVSNGLKSNRDAWAYNSSKNALIKNMKRGINHYNQELTRVAETHPEYVSKTGYSNQIKTVVDKDETKWSWIRSDYGRIANQTEYALIPSMVRVAIYRPFHKRFSVFDRTLNNDVSQLPRLYPNPDTQNYGISLSSPGRTTPFYHMATNCIPDLENVANCKHLARWHFVEPDKDTDLFKNDFQQKVTNLNPNIVAGIREITNVKDLSDDDVFAYVYGILHSHQFRDEFEANLKKEAPRIPIIANTERFRAYVEAGQALLDLHIDYDNAELHPAVTENWSVEPEDKHRFVGDKKMRQPKITDPKSGKKVADPSRLIYNEYLTLENIPEEAHHWRLGTRTATEWIIDRYYITTHKASGIVNDPNQWGLEQDPPNPNYIIDLIKRVITVACVTHKIVESLPALTEEDLGA